MIRTRPLPSMILLLLGLVLAAGTARGAEQVLSLDPEMTTVSFHLGATGHDVEGILHLDRGELRFDPETGTASGEITLDARRSETGSKSRDKTMHKKVLESEKFPFFVFRADRLEGTLAPQGSSEISLVGTLTLHGEDHPLTLPAKVEIDGDRVEASTTFPIPYVAWGLKDPSIILLSVAKQVEVTVKAHGTLQAGTRETAGGDAGGGSRP